MKRYLLDTNICVFYLRNKGGVTEQMLSVGFSSLYVSEITVLELMVGAENSQNPEKNKKAVSDFLKLLQIIPIYPTINAFAKEKIRLQKIGTPLDSLDLLIGIASVHHNMIMVTNNTRHFQTIHEIVLEDWVRR